MDTRKQSVAELRHAARTCAILVDSLSIMKEGFEKFSEELEKVGPDISKENVANAVLNYANMLSCMEYVQRAVDDINKSAETSKRCFLEEIRTEENNEHRKVDCACVD